MMNIEDGKNGYSIICKIGSTINSAKNEFQLYAAIKWCKMLCDRHLWLKHHQIKFDFVTVIKKKELSKEIVQHGGSL